MNFLSFVHVREDPPSKGLGCKALWEMEGHYVLDRMNGWCGLHLNLGRAPDVLIETVTKGPEVLRPLIAPNDWHPSISYVTTMLERVLSAIYRSTNVPNSTEVLLYSPVLVCHGHSVGDEILAAQVQSIETLDNFGGRGLKIRGIFSGSPVINLTDNSKPNVTDPSPPLPSGKF